MHEILLYGDIGGANTAEKFARDLSKINADTITVRINSPGGDVYEALAMMNALRSHPARITCVVEGLAASAASFIAIGGADRVVAHPNSEIMIHDALTSATGNAKDYQRTIDGLNRVSNNVAAIYAAKAGGTVQDWRQRMEAETWFTAAEAKAAGLVDEITTTRTNNTLIAEYDMSTFKYAGRTNAPAPDTNPEDKPMNLRNELIRMLDLDPDVTDEELLATVQTLLDEKDANAPDPNTDTPTPPSNNVVVDMTVFEEMKNLMAAGVQVQQQPGRLAAEAVVDTAIRQSRISAVHREKVIAEFLVNPDATRDRLNKISPGTINRLEQGHNVASVDAYADVDPNGNQIGDRWVL